MPNLQQPDRVLHSDAADGTAINLDRADRQQTEETGLTKYRINDRFSTKSKLII